jgi:hypothetical protein
MVAFDDEKKRPLMYGACYFGDFEKTKQEFLMPLAPTKGLKFLHVDIQLFLIINIHPSGENKNTIILKDDPKKISHPNHMWGQAGFSAYLSANAKVS